MRTIATRLLPGQDLKKGIEDIVKDKEIEAGFIITCIGSLSKAVLRLAGENVSKTFTEKYEIVSVMGTLSKDGIHVHIGLADKNGNTIGGHLKEGCIVRTTAEIVIGISDEYVFSRELDKNTGFKELKI